jgi:chemotaxis signal transduction protein
VDEVRQVVRLPASAVEPRPGGAGGAGAEDVAAIGRDGARFFILLDAASLLRDAVAPGAAA